MELHGQKGKRPGSSHFLYIKKKLQLQLQSQFYFIF
jgi:hypothetical protein